MAQTFSGTLHLSSASSGVSATPATLVIWTNNSGGQGRRIFQLNGGGGSETTCLGVFLNTTAADNKLSAYRSSSSGSTQQLTSAITTGAWQHYACVFAGNSSVAAYLNGGNKGAGSATLAVTGLAATLISGRPSDFSFGIGGQAAHAALYSRALSDTEVAYLGSGGNPRAIKGLVNYWKIATVSGTPESPVVDQIGSNDLTPSGTMGAGTSDPSIETFLTGSNVGAQNYTVGTAITSVNVGTTGTGPKFDEVSAPGTSTLKQLGTATTVGTTASSGTAVREFALSTLTGIVVDSYIKVTTGGTPTRVLATNATTISVLVAADQTFSSGAQVYTLPVNALSVAGLSISSNVYSGTAVANQTNTLCFFRYTCTANSACVADTDLFTMTITGGGGGGGGGLMLPAGMFAGGFIGG